MKWSLLTLGMLLAVPDTGLLAQGTDSCWSATFINSPGTYPFNNTAATTDGASDCSGQPVHRDVWYCITAPQSANYRIALCGGTALETRLAVYNGNNCNTSPLMDCNANACGDQSIVHFLGIAGTDYLIRIGSKDLGSGGSGTFVVSIDPCPGASDDALEPNDTCASSNALSDGGYGNLFVARDDPDYYSFDLDVGDTMQISLVFNHANGDIDAYLYDECDESSAVAQGTSTTSNELITYTNTTGCAQTLSLRVEISASGFATDCNDYSMSVGGQTTGPPCGPGTNYCTGSVTANSTGFPALISATGSASVSANDIVLTTQPVPNQPGIFFYGPDQVAAPFGNGTLCVGPGALGIARLPVENASGNVITHVLDNTMSPSVPTQIDPGETWNFSTWFRDPAAGGAFFNLSDGLEITFTP